VKRKSKNRVVDEYRAVMTDQVDGEGESKARSHKHNIESNTYVHNDEDEAERTSREREHFTAPDRDSFQGESDIALSTAFRSQQRRTLGTLGDISELGGHGVV
jgi:hypothetical protein